MAAKSTFEVPYSTREVTWIDDAGRRFRVLIPAGAPDEDADHGLILGPPDLRPLGLPVEIEVRLHNALEGRGIITARDAASRPEEIVRALLSSFKASAQSVQALYIGD